MHETPVRVVDFRPDLAPRLRVIDEGGRAATPFELALVRQVMVLGRAADLRLDDPAVSRRHLALVRDLSGTLLIDLGGRSGVRLNGSTLPPGLTLRLRDGDEIAVGRSRLRYEDVGTGAIAPTPALPRAAREPRPARRRPAGRRLGGGLASGVLIGLLPALVVYTIMHAALLAFGPLR